MAKKKTKTKPAMTVKAQFKSVETALNLADQLFEEIDDVYDRLGDGVDTKSVNRAVKTASKIIEKLENLL